jgi:transposase
VFIDRKRNKSGSWTIRLCSKVGRKSVVIKTFGSAAETAKLQALELQAQDYMQQLRYEDALDFAKPIKPVSVELLEDLLLRADLRATPVGPNMLLGPIYEQIGFGSIKEPLLKDLVIGRLVLPSSKLRASRYLMSIYHEHVDVNRLYRLMDKVNTKYKTVLETISLAHTKQILGGEIGVVFYDVTTLYFETSQPDELRITGFSKDGKHQHPQILLGLLVSNGGYPLSYTIVEGNKYEGHTMMPVLEAFKARLSLDKLMVVADAGLLSKANITALEANGYQYILGARIKAEPQKLQHEVLQAKYEDGVLHEFRRSAKQRLIVGYSASRAKKDEFNRKRGIAKLEKMIASGRLTKASLNQRGYNKFLEMKGEVQIGLDKQRVEEELRWDGLKGYITNSELPLKAVIAAYNELWQIEKAFRISKSDLEIRPVYHRLQRRIEAHVCLAFCSYKLYKELERQLVFTNAGVSAKRAIEIMSTIQNIEIEIPELKKTVHRLTTLSPVQTALIAKMNLKTQEKW